MSLNGGGPPLCNSSNTFYGSVSVLLGNGDGTFQSQNSYPAGIAPYGIAAGALKKSGNEDLLVTDGSDGSLLVLSGNGDGTFQSPVIYPADGGNFLTLGDFNGDGNLDVVASGVSLVEFLGNGDGTLQQAIDYYRSTPGNPYFYEIGGDFNGDGQPDIAVGFQFVFSAFLNAIGTTRQPTTTTVQAVYKGCGSVTVTANVAASGVTPTGTLTLQLDGHYSTAGQFGSLDSSGSATANVSSQAVGLHTIKVIYSGDGLTQVSSGTSSVDVPLQASTTTLTSDPNPSVTGDYVVFSSLVSSPGPSSGCISGSVTFLSGTTTLGTSTVSQGSAGVSHEFLTAGDYPVTASYSGSTYVAPSVSAVLTQVVNPGGNLVLNPGSLSFPATTVGQSSTPESVTLTNTRSEALTIAAVSSSGDFTETNNCGATIAASQSCSIQVTFTPSQSGSRTGSLTIADSAPGSPQTVALTGTGQDFSVTPSSQTTATVPPGTPASYSISIAPSGGFPQTVTLACTGAPPESTCSLSPSTLTLAGSSAATATVTVKTTARRSARLTPTILGPLPDNQTPGNPVGVLGALVFIIGLTILTGRSRRLLEGGLLLRCRLTLLFPPLPRGCMSACGGTVTGGGGGGGITGTPSGTYSLTVSASFTSSSGTVTRTTNLTLIVQ